jgi:hypothetical protein
LPEDSADNSGNVSGGEENKDTGSGTNIGSDISSDTGSASGSRPQTPVLPLPEYFPQPDSSREDEPQTDTEGDTTQTDPESNSGNSQQDSQTPTGDITQSGSEATEQIPPTEPVTQETEDVFPQSGNEGTSSQKPGNEGNPKIKVTPLVNLPLYSAYMFFIGVITAVAYWVYWMFSRQKQYAAVTTEGTVVHRRSKSLSARDVERAVKENPPTPSAALDSAVLNAVRQLEQEK